MERARQQHLDGYNPYLVAARLKELETEAAAARAGLSAPYAEALLAHSSYKKPQQDKWVVLAGVVREGPAGRTCVVCRLCMCMKQSSH
jgi:hypothetical protein